MDGDVESTVGDDTATPNADAGKNTYSVVIRAIAGRASGDTGPAEAVDAAVTVTVTDVDEDGEVVISLLQPEVAIPITASLDRCGWRRHWHHLAVGSLRGRGECP